MERDCTIHVVKLIGVFVFAYAKSRFSHNEAHMLFPEDGVMRVVRGLSSKKNK